MKESKNLTIRVNFNSQQQNLGTNNIATEKPVYQYHWPRIITAIVVTLIVFATLISSYLYYFDQSQTPQVEPAFNKVNQVVKAQPESNQEIQLSEEVTKEALVVEKAQVIAPQNTNNNSTAIDLTKNSKVIGSTQTLTLDPEKPEIAEQKKITTLVQQETQKAQNSSELEHEKVQITDENKAADEITIKVQNEDKLVAPNTPINKLFTEANTEIFSENIKRFTVAQSIQSNEPVGTLNDISFDNNIATVFAFSEANNIKNTTLYYLWSFNGKNVATVKIAVRGDRWRSHSSKFIQLNMHGQWKVELQNAQKQTLAISEFNY